MKRFLFLVLASCVVVMAQAQKVYFMYLQSENAAPFFVKMADKVYSSTATGYVILSNLKDSTYTFSVGFPGGKAAETRFGVTINGADRGFLLKNFDEGLSLFDLQTLGVIKSIAAAGVPDNVQVIARTDAFTKHLSEAADDESLLYTTVAVKKEEPKREEKKEVKPEAQPDVAVEKKLEPKSDVVPVVDTGAAKTTAEKPATETAKAPEPAPKDEPKTDTLVAAAPAKQEEVKKEESAVASIKEPEVKKDTVVSQPVQPVETASKPTEPKAEPVKEESAIPYQRSEVTKKSESSTTEGFGLVYLDRHNEVVDTIRLLIPNPKKPFVESAEAAVKESPKPKAEEAIKEEATAKAEEPKGEEVKDETSGKAAKGKKQKEKTLASMASDLFKAPKETSREAKAENKTAAKEADEQRAEELVKADATVKTAEPKQEEVKQEGAGTAPADTKPKEKTLASMASGLFKGSKEQTLASVENKACSAVATERDFLKVRKNMAAETNDEAMIDEAKVFFRNKCFTTQQIKDLSGLFLTSAAKYEFFDAAFKHVTDPSEFPSLQSEIKDSYYLKRFKALIGE